MHPETLRQAKILIVDDELANVRLLELILGREGYSHVSITTDPRTVVPLFQEKELPDLLLLDLHMPHCTGYEIMEALGRLRTPESHLPIIVLTADATADAKRRALTSGAIDFVCKPFDNLEVLHRIKNALEIHFLYSELVTQNQVLDQRVRERTVQLEMAVANLNSAQEQVVQQESLHALGRMSAGIAHDFNNVLSLILGYGEMLMSDRTIASMSGPPINYVQNIISATRDAVQMVQRLAQFQRPASASDPRQAIGLSDLVTQAIEMSRPRWKEQTAANGIDISTRTEFADASEIVGDPAEIRELVINAIFNAVDAMPQGGTISFRTCTEGENVVLEIEDTGVGMSEETRARCLEPFFTTKGQQGSGLGLPMIYGITHRHGGTLDIQTKLGAGTCISIRLPHQILAALPEAVATLAPVEPLRVLVVDDQPMLCEILTEYLLRDGHRVATALNGEEALEKFQTAAFDLVITDKAMPGMNGHQLAAAVRKLRQETLIILLTGFAESGVSASMEPEIDAVVGKPVALETLREAVAHAVALRPPPASAPPERHIPAAGFLRTGPDPAQAFEAIKAQLSQIAPAAYLQKPPDWQDRGLAR